MGGAEDDQNLISKMSVAISVLEYEPLFEVCRIIGWEERMSAIFGQLSLQLSKRGNRKRRLNSILKFQSPSCLPFLFFQRLPEPRRKRVVR